MKKQSVKTAPGFWERQFRGEPTSNQNVFDALFGVVAPILCFMLDPIVFSERFSGTPLLEDYKLFAYMFSGLEMIALASWLSLGLRSRLLNGFIGGVLIAGGIFSAILGAVLAPYSLIGLMFLIGVLGFTPFVTAFVYFRNGSRAVLKSDLEGYEPRPSMALLGLLLSLSGSLFLSRGLDEFMTNSVNDMIYGSEQQALAAAHRIRPLSLVNEAKCRRLVDEFQQTSDSQRKDHLNKLYREATGEEIQYRIRFVD